MSVGSQKRTTVTIQESTHERLKEVKPYESLSWDEFLRELADEYAGDETSPRE